MQNLAKDLLGYLHKLLHGNRQSREDNKVCENNAETSDEFLRNYMSPVCSCL
jgi:hypothetical protein